MTKPILQFCALALTVSNALVFKLFYIEQLGRDHRVHLSQRRYSMADIKIYKNGIALFFPLALTVNNILAF